MYAQGIYRNIYTFYMDVDLVVRTVHIPDVSHVPIVWAKAGLVSRNVPPATSRGAYLVDPTYAANSGVQIPPTTLRVGGLSLGGL